MPTAERRLRKRGTPRFRIDADKMQVLRRVAADGQALLDRIVDAVDRDPDGARAGHLAGQGADAISRGAWGDATRHDLEAAIGSSTGTLYGARSVARVFPEAAVPDLYWSKLVQVGRLHKLRDRNVITAARDDIVRQAIAGDLSERQIKRLVNKYLDAR